MFGGGGETHEITPFSSETQACIDECNNTGEGVKKLSEASRRMMGWGEPNKLILTEAETAKAMSESRRTGNRAVRIKTTKDIRGHIVTLNGTFRIDEPRKKPTKPKPPKIVVAKCGVVQSRECGKV